MSTELWVFIGALLIMGGTFIIWYIPYKESKNKEAEIRESGKFSKRISIKIKNPLLCFGQSCFNIDGEDHIPIITDGKGKGLLYIPTKKGTGEGIIYSWVQNQEMKLSLTIHDITGEVISYISGNEWVVNKSASVDCNYDLYCFEVVKIKEGIIKPLLQVELQDDRIQIGLETWLKDGTHFFWGNNRMEFSGENHKIVNNDLKLLFKYPSEKHFGKRN